jgi:putative Holliday junction resolvase
MSRILGVDHGDRRIGLAISDPIPLIASPLKTLTVDNTEQAILEIENVIKEEEIQVVVIGLPLGMNGQDTQQTDHVKKFAEKLQQILNIPVFLEDERLSSVTARKAIIHQKLSVGRNKALVDQTAASIILQQYLDKLSR